jgi:hypothetical protein
LVSSACFFEIPSSRSLRARDPYNLLSSQGQRVVIKYKTSIGHDFSRAAKHLIKQGFSP